MISDQRLDIKLIISDQRLDIMLMISDQRLDIQLMISDHRLDCMLKKQMQDKMLKAISSMVGYQLEGGQYHVMIFCFRFFPHISSPPSLSLTVDFSSF
jgi:hypothetical protein